MKSAIIAGCLASALVIGLALIPVGARPAGAAPEPQKKKNEVVGAVWEFEARESMKKTAQVIESGRFRATLDGKIFTPKGNQVGTYSYTNKAQDGVRLNFTQGKLKGSSELVKSRYSNPAIWQGNWKMEDGSTAHLVIRMIKD